MTKIILILSIVALGQFGHAQGFINLNFESGNVSGPTDTGGGIPIATALPGWTGNIAGQLGGTDFSYAVTDVYANWLSTGGAGVSLINKPTGLYAPLEGNNSVFLFGQQPGNISTTISQTGEVPASSQSLQIDIADIAGPPGVPMNPFQISLGGQNLTMVPMTDNGSYTIYGGNIPQGDAGQSLKLSVSALPPALGFTSPSMLLIDDIKFSSFAVVPEPGTWLLLGTGLAMVVLFRRRNGSA